MAELLFNNLEILKFSEPDASEPARRAIDFAAALAHHDGATIFRTERTKKAKNPFYKCDETVLDIEDANEWAKLGTGKHRIVLGSDTTNVENSVSIDDAASIVTVQSAPWETEETLFAASGIADLLGAIDREPLIPNAHYAAHSVGYSVYAAICCLHVAAERFGVTHSAQINALAVMAWINWKAGAAGAMGKDIRREGVSGEWPVLPCKDGYTAFLFTERDWPMVVEMIGDPRLEDERLEDFDGRAIHRTEYLAVIREWLADKTKLEADQEMIRFGIPGASVVTVDAMPDDPLLKHRKSIASYTDDNGTPFLSPKPACRVHREEVGAQTSAAMADTDLAPLPLADMRVLDLGIITAGAGVSALLSDFGAEVIKVEAASYPDPFRYWAGSDDSPLFKFNNRNKQGIAVDLKTTDGKETFLALAKDADIVVENFRRGVLDRLGMTFDALREANPNILLASISGQGLEGPGSEHATFGSTLEANSGFASLTTYEDGVPHVTGRNLNYPDQIVCIYGAAAIAAHVHYCRTHGVARHIDISQRDCATYQLGDVIAERSLNKSSSHGRAFASADEKYVALSKEAIDYLCHAEGLDSKDTTAIVSFIKQVASADLIDRLREKSLGAAACLLGSQMMKHPSVRNFDVFLKSPSGAAVKGYPFQFAQTPMKIRSDAPKVGEHTEEILKRIGR